MSRPKSRQSCAAIISSIGVSGSKIRKLREQSKAYLLLHTHHSIGQISSISFAQITVLAKKFLIQHGNKYFSPQENTNLIWPKDKEQLVVQISRVMLEQKKQRIELHTAKKRASQARLSNGPRDASEEDGSQSPEKKRKATEGCEEYHPETTHTDGENSKIYATRANAQPGMPVLPSIEENDSPSAGRSQPIDKRPCTTSVTQRRTWRAINTPSLAQPRATEPDSRPTPKRRQGISINIPIRSAMTGQSRKKSKQKSRPPPDSPVQPIDNGAEKENASPSRVTQRLQRPYAMTGDPMIDEFILENYLHLEATPTEHRLTPLSDYRPQPQCQPTPPRSSLPRSHIDSNNSETRSTSSSVSGRYRSDVGDSKEQIRLMSIAREYPNIIDLTGPEVVEIQTGENHFKNIDRARAPRVLQKLLDVFMDELKICRRNVRQAPDGQKKRIWEIRTTQLEEVLQTVRNDEKLWQGGSISDRTLAML